MAKIFLARRAGAGAGPVAIKVMHPRIADIRGFREMFIDEARLSAMVRHPNVVSVGELGQDRGTLYLPMEYIGGRTLTNVLSTLRRAGKVMSVEIAAAIAFRVARGLHAAHEATDADGQLLQLIHRDVTPSNVLIADDGQVKIIDFGVAMAKIRVHRTEPGVLKGKPGYVAPEQIKLGRLDRRVDVYTVGVLLWECLTGARLFPRATHERIGERASGCLIVPPSRWRADMPPALESLVMDCLEPDPSQRPGTAAAFADALGRAVPRADEIDQHEIREYLEGVIPPDQTQERRPLVIEDEPARNRLQIAMVLALVAIALLGVVLALLV